MFIEKSPIVVDIKKAQNKFSRSARPTNSKYTPHQGKRECARRRKYMEHVNDPSQQ